MAGITAQNMTDEKTWEDFLSRASDANFLQSWHWGEFHRALGSMIHRTGFYRGRILTGVMLSIVEDARRARYLTVPGGPIIDWHDAEQVQSFVSRIKILAKDERCAFVRVRPQLRDDAFARTLFKQYGFVDAPIHLHAELTSQLDLNAPQEHLLAEMRKATRYEIKKAIAEGITVTATDDPATIRKFYDLQILTSQRQKFVPFPYSFLFEQFRVFARAGKALLYSAELEGKLLAQAFIIFYGREAAYHYGASTEEGRKHPGAYLIQWEAIKEARKRGMQRYNFWGVSPEGQKTHRFYGLSVFKRGFGGTDIAYLHAQDLVINRPRYLANCIVENMRKRIRRV